MILTALLSCVVVCVNALYAAAAAVAAKKYGIDAGDGRWTGLTVLLLMTGVEIAELAVHSNGVPSAIFIVAFGAVATGAAYDAACGYVFDAVTLPCLAAMAVCSALTHSLMIVAGGAAVAGGSLALLYAITRGRGLGLGDVKLAGCIGGCTGAIGGLEALGVAFVLGGGYAGYLLLTKRGRRGDELRFAPYMAAGLAIVAVHGGLS